ncbi:hypothetical protein AVEN_88090-1 [Araneus ventricosus]|uniref:Uncharacterized protein n=1 Tax=Araneus ventricosus TaxID=182803 RepID=A0A4Y2NEU6_ARAVE|nr:hypothetical protein AVEN_88090-1 [Araneus ventricosus]
MLGNHLEYSDAEVQNPNSAIDTHIKNSAQTEITVIESNCISSAKAVENIAARKRDCLFAQSSALLRGRNANYKFRLKEDERIQAFALLRNLRNLLGE